MATTPLIKFLESMKAPRLAELRCSGFLAITGGNLPLAKLIAARERVILEESDWEAAIAYAKEHGLEVTRGEA